jgi:prepilin-type N-terminal cleavage/methylation domain-containing protein
MDPMKNVRPSGFTLIEVIVAIVLSAIAMAAILPMLDRVFLLSHEPRTTLQAGLDLQTAMDGLVTLHDANDNNVGWLKTNLLANRIVLPAGISVVASNTYNVDFVLIADGRWREKPSGSVTSTNLLKVTLRNSLGERATRLFTVPPL